MGTGELEDRQAAWQDEIGRLGPVGTLVAVGADASCCAPFATNVPRVPGSRFPKVGR